MNDINTNEKDKAMEGKTELMDDALNQVSGGSITREYPRPKFDPEHPTRGFEPHIVP